MVRLFIFILFIPFIAKAQYAEAMHPSQIRELKLHSVSRYDTANGKKYLEERKSFDTLGRTTSRVRIHTHHDTVEYKRDTILYYTDRIVYVMDSKWIDSTVSYTPSTMHGSDRISKDFLKGKVINMHIITGDSIRGEYVTESYKDDTILWRNIRKHYYTYDHLGRVTSSTTSDSTYYKQLRVEWETQSYDIVYTDHVVIRSDYNDYKGRHSLYRRTYMFENRNQDSTVSYDDKGRVSGSNISRYDSLHRQVESIHIGKRKKISYRITTTYYPDSILQKNFDGKGNIQTQTIILLNKNELITRRTVTGIEGPWGEWYEYTYY